MRKIWSFFSSIRLTIYLTYAIVINAIIGSFLVISDNRIYSEIDRTLLLAWWQETGSQNLDSTWWIVLIIILVFFFGINTLVCSIDRLIPLFRFFFREKVETVTSGGKDMQEEDPSIFRRKSIAAFYPYLAHFGFLIALIGHLAGSVSGFKSHGNIVPEGGVIPVPHVKGLFLVLDRFDFSFSRYGYPEDMKSHVRLFEGREAVRKEIIEINSPLVYKGTAFYASDFRQGPDGRIYVSFDVIRDPGVWIVFTGLFIFTAGVLLTLFVKRDWELAQRTAN